MIEYYTSQRLLFSCTPVLKLSRKLTRERTINIFLPMGKWDRRNGQYKGKTHRQDVREHSVTMHASIVDEVNSDDDEGVHDDEAVDHPPPRIATRICLWEFGQNDPKR